MNEKEIKKDTDQVIEEISKVSQEDMDQVAGGEGTSESCGQPYLYRKLCKVPAACGALMKEHTK